MAAPLLSWPPLLPLLLLPLLLLLLAAGPVQPASQPPPPPDPLADLARVLGVRRVPQHLRATATAPLFLRRLFDSVTDGDGRAVRAVPYHSDSVVAYTDRAPGDQGFYAYNFTRRPYQASIRFADMHLFRLRRGGVGGIGGSGRRRKRDAVAPPLPSASRIVKLKLYQVTDPRRRGTPYGNILLAQKLIPIDYHGWIVFEVSQAVLNWMESSGVTNHGLALFAYYANGDPLPSGQLRFVQRGENRDVLQPALMVYGAEQTRSRKPELEDNSLNRAFDSFDPGRYAGVYGGSFALSGGPAPPPGRRSRRSAAASAAAAESPSSSAVGVEESAPPPPKPPPPPAAPASTTCRRYPMYVDFAKVGWDEWIISPSGFNAFFCSGHCPFPLGQQFHPSNHAVVQSIMNHLGPRISGPVPKPSCVPSRLASINMLYYDDNDRVVLKQYDDMIAIACGCQ